jgi:organic radical activating enzyme
MTSMNTFVAAGQVPWKALQLKDFVLKCGSIVPVHLQFYPTNRCNAKCPWCSCAESDRTLEMPIEEIRQLVDYFADLGTLAVTITGGGEPTIHKNFQDILRKFSDRQIKIGLVSNGIMWGRMDADPGVTNEVTTWMRISIYDTIGDYDTNIVQRICRKLPAVDMSVSFTVDHNVNLGTAERLCRLANDTPNMTHLRFVQNILDPDHESFKRLVDKCQGITPKAIFQYRDTWTKGAKKCLIAMLKPVVNVDGMLYPCCGTQYALGITRQMPKQMSMGHWRDFHKLSSFDGSICKKCYYESYNKTLEMLAFEKLKHMEFV